MAAPLAYLLVFIGVCGHASSEFFSILSGVSGPEASVWRYALGAFGLLIISLAMPSTRDLWTPLQKHPLYLTVISILGVAFAYLFFHWALDYATPIQVGTLVTTIPIFVGLTNLVMNKVPLTGPKLLTGGAAIAGVALLLTDGYLAKLATDSNQIIGVVMSIACAALGSAFSVLIRPIINEYGAIRITTITLSIGAIALWIIVAVFFGIAVNPLNIFERSTEASLSLLILGFWNTTITQICWLGGLAAVPDITRGSYLFFLKPVITAALAILFLGTAISGMQILAIAVICGAVALEFIWAQRIAAQTTAA